MTYSTSEHVVGEWIDGKPLYEKTINFGALPNTTTKSISLSSDTKLVIDIEGFVNRSGYYRPLPYPTYEANYGIRVGVDNNQLVVATGVDWSSYSAYITIRYTKTTD